MARNSPRPHLPAVIKPSVPRTLGPADKASLPPGASPLASQFPAVVQRRPPAVNPLPTPPQPPRRRGGK